MLRRPGRSQVAFDREALDSDFDEFARCDLGGNGEATDHRRRVAQQHGRADCRGRAEFEDRRGSGQPEFGQRGFERFASAGASLAGHERGCCECFDRHRGAARPGMAGRDDGHELVVFDDPHGQVVDRRWRLDEAQVGVARTQAFDDVRRVGDFERDRVGRVFLRELLQPLRKQVLGDREARRDPKTAVLLRLKCCQPGLELVGRSQDLFRPASEHHARVGWRRARRAAVEQLQSDLAFQVLEPAAGRRLGHAVHPRGGRHTAQLDDRHEQVERGEIGERRAERHRLSLATAHSLNL